VNRSLSVPRSANPLLAVADQLVIEYQGIVPPGAVLRCVARCRYQLRRAGVRAGLDHAVEAMARHRLRQLQAGRLAG
jgi:hypothetical protein